ncbi:hypothetical protein KQ302_12890 [Synechococcus sp. CS-602]|nr:hypothetical protein BM449_04690 [Synechococcus sp. SynAce01]MCT0201435.1 hypothetical protein [Synechococcus sp. CS-603]MCT0205986.1 hypothetical protein [Synechococcus sp. CS-602]MCT0245161.1 hypothetical protein [Synechococcus sp. CS-601]
MGWGRRVSLATRHGKEKVIARPFRKGLGAELVLASGFDTDSLGSFSGERPRLSDAETTCRLKAEAGMAETGLDLGLASEGSFGPHPALPFLPLAMEWMAWVDRAQGLVITEQLVGCRTNFDHCTASPGADLDPWLDRIGFPTHAVIVQPHRARAKPCLSKGLGAVAELREAIEQASRASSDGLALLETDMRAHQNPTRMASIRVLAFKLVRRIASPCPTCGAPGWGRVDVLLGLPCDWCGTATDLVRSERFGCVSCSASEERPRADGLTKADPQFCPLCNP